MAGFKPKIGAAFGGRTDTQPTVGKATKIRTTVDLDRPFWAEVQGWLGAMQAETGSRLQLAPVMRELLREITGQALSDDATEEERAAVTELARRIAERAGAA
jgi:hypothetical protein